MRSTATGLRLRDKARQTYCITANEGDDRGEDERIEDLTLDPIAFPDAATLQLQENLGRLGVSRSMATPMVTVIQTSCSRTVAGPSRSGTKTVSWFGTAATCWNRSPPTHFRVFQRLERYKRGCANPFEDRSDNKGPEPEAVTIARYKDELYAFIGLERIGGTVVYNVSDPEDPEFVLYENSTGTSLLATRPRTRPRRRPGPREHSVHQQEGQPDTQAAVGHCQ